MKNDFTNNYLLGESFRTSSKLESTYKEDVIVDLALDIVRRALKTNGVLLSGPTKVANYLKLKLSKLELETFGMLLLDSQTRLIEDVNLFTGSINHCSVYPREIVKNALLSNACSVVIYHNHPSGNEQPSLSDVETTTKIKQALALVDVVLHDHIIIAKDKTYCFSENGMI